MSSIEASLCSLADLCVMGLTAVLTTTTALPVLVQLGWGSAVAAAAMYLLWCLRSKRRLANGEREGG